MFLSRTHLDQAGLRLLCVTRIRAASRKLGASHLRQSAPLIAQILRYSTAWKGAERPEIGVVFEHWWLTEFPTPKSATARPTNSHLSGRVAQSCRDKARAVSEVRSAEFARAPGRSSNAANPQGRAAGCPGGLLRGDGQASPLGSPMGENGNQLITQSPSIARCQCSPQVLKGSSHNPRKFIFIPRHPNPTLAGIS